jgi:hypothetical protein
MFEAAAAHGGLQIQLVYYRDCNECKVSRWVSTAADLHHLMRAVHCIGGLTQIARVLDHAIDETNRNRVGALIFVGDACEEPPDRLCPKAGTLGQLEVPMFIFHEGGDLTVTTIFRHIAALTGGAYLPFDSTAPERLKILLGGIAAYAAGGRKALESYAQKQGGAVLLLTQQLPK